MSTVAPVVSSSALHHSDSQRSAASERPRVHFRHGVDVKRYRPRQRSPQIHREPPPASGSPELERETAEVIKALDSVQCDVSNTERPVDNGLRQQKERIQSGVSSLSRASLRRKKNRAGLNSISTNTLPAPTKRKTTPEPSPPVVDIEVDKNNIIKAENLLREGRGSLLHVDGLLKRSSSQVDHLNNLNSLKDNPGKHKDTNCLDDRLDSEILIPYKSEISSEKRDKVGDSVDQHPFVSSIQITNPSDPPSSKRADSSSQTSPRHDMSRSRHNDRGIASLVASTSALASSPLTRQPKEGSPPPPRPERTPPQTTHYKPKGFSYLGRGDMDLIERDRTDSDVSQSRSVIAQSQNIIEQIRRDRSLSPVSKPVRRQSPPELIVPTQFPAWMRSREHEDPPEVERGYRKDPDRHNMEYSPPDRAKAQWNDTPEHTWRYRDDQSREKSRTHRFDIPPPETKTFQTPRGPQIIRTYYEDMTPPKEPSPRRSWVLENEPERTSRLHPAGTMPTYRYDSDSAGEPRMYREDSPGHSSNTRTYRFTSGSDKKSRTSSSYRVQGEPPRSSDTLDPPELIHRTSSIVMIGVDDPEPEPVSTSPRRPAFSRLSTLVEGSVPDSTENPHYRSPHYSSPPTGRDSDNVVRLSVTGSHSSSNRDSPTEKRKTSTTVATNRTRITAEENHSRNQRTEKSHRRRPDDPNSRSHSRETSPAREVRPSRRTTHSVDRDTSTTDRRRQQTRRVSSSSESPRRRGGDDLHDPVVSDSAINGHGRRNGQPRAASSTLEKARRRTERRDDSSASRHRGDKKKKISIKFMYDDDDEKPAERLAKYTEYTGDEDDPRSPRRQERPRESTRDGWKSDKFLTSLIEESRSDVSERRDGWRGTPPSQDNYHKKPHGAWSSRSEEDLIDADYRKTHKNSTATTSHTTREEREKTRSSVSSEDGRRHRHHDSRERSPPPRDDNKDRLSPIEGSRRDASSSPEPGKPRKTSWLSATLSRLDLKSKKKENQENDKSPSRDKGSRSPSKDSKSPSKSETPRDKEKSSPRSGSRAGGSTAGRAASERRETRRTREYTSSGQESSSHHRRREYRSGSRDSHATSEERDLSSGERRYRSDTAERRRARSSEERSQRSSVPRDVPERQEQRSQHRSNERVTRGSSAGGSRQPPSRTGSYIKDRRPVTEDNRRGSHSVPRSSVSRTASFSRRYPDAGLDETDGSRQGTVGRRAGRRVSAAADSKRPHRHSRSVTSSVNSSGSDAGSPGVAASHTSNRSVFLHATTVADIPAPHGPADEVEHQPAGDEPLPTRERRKVHRSFSVLSPFKLSHKDDREIKYDNKDGHPSVNGSGRPPRAPRVRRDSRDTEQEEQFRDRGGNRSSSRFSSLPRGSRASSRYYRNGERPTR